VLAAGCVVRHVTTGAGATGSGQSSSCRAFEASVSALSQPADLCNASCSAGSTSQLLTCGWRCRYAEFFCGCMCTLQDVGRFCILGATLGQMPGWCSDLKYAAALGTSVWRLWKPRPGRCGAAVISVVYHSIVMKPCRYAARVLLLPVCPTCVADCPTQPAACAYVQYPTPAHLVFRLLVWSH
jgi:hypothetical protein